MSLSNSPRSSAAAAGTAADFDAIVIGAGFSGLCALHKLRDELGLKVLAIDNASDVGGTWYWNRYPGALSDSEAFVYCYSFDKDLFQDWKWTTRFVSQPQILSYLQFVAERFDLRRSIQFETTINSAHYDESRDLWRLQTDQGETLTAQFLITALGPLAASNIPEIDGRENFRGKQYHTSAWPHDAELDNQRVGVIGTGSTGIQLITAIAPKVAHLTVFQRTPQYSVPVGNGPVSEDSVAEVQRNSDAHWDNVFDSFAAMGFEESTVPAMSVSPQERHAIFQKAWDAGGSFAFSLGTFCDIFVDRQANEAAAAFIREKIAEIVDDPDTAAKLTPYDVYAKRPLCDSGYYQIYNRDNVALVDVTANPITEITEHGVKTADGVEHPLDVLIYATGFDAVDGNYKRLDIRGRDGQSISEHWADGALSYLGAATSGFPNMFMVQGPNGPFSNAPPAIELQVDLAAQLIQRARDNHAASIEVTPEAEEGWIQTCVDIADQTLFGEVDSWFYGANIAGKPRRVLFFVGGVAAYRQAMQDAQAGGFAAFIQQPEPAARNQPPSNQQGSVA